MSSDPQETHMTQHPLRNHMHGRSLATYFMMGSGSGQTLHIHLHCGASSLISTCSCWCWPITSSTIIYLRFIVLGFSLYFHHSDLLILRFTFDSNMLSDISKDASNCSVASVNKSPRWFWNWCWFLMMGSGSNCTTPLCLQRSDTEEELRPGQM